MGGRGGGVRGGACVGKLDAFRLQKAKADAKQRGVATRDPIGSPCLSDVKKSAGACHSSGKKAAG